jgi:hypothetical protein
VDLRNARSVPIERGFARIVTKTVNSVYQKHGCMPVPQAPKISLANKAK